MSLKQYQINSLQLARALKCGLFAEMEFNDAYQYATKIAQASENPAAVLTAVHVVMNSIAKEVERTLIE